MAAAATTTPTMATSPSSVIAQFILRPVCGSKVRSRPSGKNDVTAKPTIRSNRYGDCRQRTALDCAFDCEVSATAIRWR